MKIKTLEFELVDDSGREFLCTFQSESTQENILMNVTHNKLPLDVVELEGYDRTLMDNINKLMESTALNYWMHESV